MMHVSVALLLAVVVFEGEFYKGSAVPAILNVTNTLEINVVAEAETQEDTKKFVPALFFKTNWFRAYQYCRFHGMYLASIESADEEKQLMSVLKKTGLLDVEHISFWTSGNDLGCEGDFVWMSSGRVMTYKNWNGKEPNGGIDENCVVVVNQSDGLYWNDISCTTGNYNFACEYYENSVENLTSTGRHFFTEYV